MNDKDFLYYIKKKNGKCYISKKLEDKNIARVRTLLSCFYWPPAREIFYIGKEILFNVVILLSVLLLRSDPKASKM